MLRIKRTAAILTAFLIMFCLTAQAEEAGKLIAAPEEAASFIETLLTDDPSALDGKYQLSAQMNLALKLSGGFEGLAKQLTSLGEIQEIGTPFETEFAGQTAFRIPCRFSAMPIDLVMLLQDGVIAGLVTAEYTDPDGEAAAETDTVCENIELALPVEGLGELPGTLSLPEGEGPFPVVVLIHGSGPNDRDETVGMLKPFRDLAEGLAEKGIAVYRFDKRSKVYGRELADDTQATLMDESIEDAVAAVQLMAGQDAIDASRIFVLGHSLGGCAIPAIDRELKTAETKAAGYILMAASPRKLWELMKEQMEYLYSLRPEVTEEELAEIDSQLQVTFDEGYNEMRHSIDSLVQYVKVSCVLTFRDNQHMALRLKTESEVDNSDLRYEGTYQVYNGYVILKYDKYRDSLVISPDGNQLVGILEDDTYQSTLTRTK